MQRKLIEALTDETFVSTIQKVDIFGLADNQEAEETRATIHWEITQESRQWGVKDIDVIVNKIVLTYDVANAETGKAVNRTLTHNFGDGWTIDVEKKPTHLPIDLYPRSLEVYLHDHRIIINM